MRDTSDDYTTGWLRNGLYEREFEPLADGSFGGLGELGQVAQSLPPLGQQYLKQALSDPATRDDAKRLLRAGGDALADQAQKDTVEFMHPTGKHKIVFKGFARQMGQKGLAAEEAVLNAMPYKDTEEGRETLDLALDAEDPKKAFEAHFIEVALEAMVPESDLFGDEQEGLFGYDDPYGLGSSKGKKKRKKKRYRKNIKKAAVAAAVVVAAVATVVTFGAAAPALLGVVGSVASSVFKPGAAKSGGAAPEGEAFVGPVPLASELPQAPLDLSWVAPVAQAAAVIAAPRPKPPAAAPQTYYQPPASTQISVTQTSPEATPQQAYQQAYQQAISQGAGDEQAGQIAQQAQGQSEVAHGIRPAQAGMFGMDTNTMLMVGAGLFIISQMSGGGGGSRRRRNPSYNPSGRTTRKRKPKECEYCGGEAGVRLIHFKSSDPPALMCRDCFDELKEKEERTGREIHRNPYGPVGWTKRGKRVWKHYCSSCGKQFRTRNALATHLKSPRSIPCFSALFRSKN